MPNKCLESKGFSLLCFLFYIRQVLTITQHFYTFLFNTPDRFLFDRTKIMKHNVLVSVNTKANVADLLPFSRVFLHTSWSSDCPFNTHQLSDRTKIMKRPVDYLFLLLTQRQPVYDDLFTFPPRHSASWSSRNLNFKFFEVQALPPYRPTHGASSSGRPKISLMLSRISNFTQNPTYYDTYI